MDSNLHWIDRDDCTGKYSGFDQGCIFVGNALAKVDLAVLEEIIAADWQAMQRLFPES